MLTEICSLNTSTVPTWQSECSRSHRRGQLVMIEGALIVCGVMIAYWVDFGFFFLDPSEVSWRFPVHITHRRPHPLRADPVSLDCLPNRLLHLHLVYVRTLLNALQATCNEHFTDPLTAFVLSLPESPRWLILKGRDDEATAVLAALSDEPKDSPYLQNEFIAIKDTVLEMEKGSFRDLFTMGPDRNFHRVVLGYVNQVFQQISGINVRCLIFSLRLSRTPTITGTVFFKTFANRDP